MRRDGGAVSGGRMRWHMVAEWREKKRGAVEWREGSNGEERWSGRSRERSVVNWGLVAGRVGSIFLYMTWILRVKLKNGPHKAKLGHQLN
jgi:hypothetical protein